MEKASPSDSPRTAAGADVDHVQMGQLLLIQMVALQSPPPRAPLEHRKNPQGVATATRWSWSSCRCWGPQRIPEARAVQGPASACTAFWGSECIRYRRALWMMVAAKEWARGGEGA